MEVPSRIDRILEVVLEYAPPLLTGTLGAAVNVLRMKRLPRFRGLVSTLLSGGFCALMLTFLALWLGWKSPLVFFLCGIGGFASDATLTKLVRVWEKRMDKLLGEDQKDDADDVRP